jgi:hypothetical protein
MDSGYGCRLPWSTSSSLGQVDAETILYCVYFIVQ